MTRGSRLTLIGTVLAVTLQAASAMAQQASGGRSSAQARADDAGRRDRPELWITVTMIDEEGGPSGGAGDSGWDPFDSYVWTGEGLCPVTAAGFAPATTPWAGWNIGGRILHQVDENSYMVEITWRRLWQDAAPLPSGPMGRMQVIMSLGSSMLLDELRVEGADTARCGHRSARVEAGVGSGAARTNALRSGLPDGPAISGGMVSFRGVGGPRTGSGVGSISAGGRGTTAGGSGRASTGSGQGAPVVRRDIPAPDEIEVWLVHTLADGSERAQKQTLRLGEDARRYVFPPLRVVAGGRELWFAVAGLVHLLPASDARPIRLIVLIERAVTDSAGERLGSGGASRTFDLTAPGEVTSLELPGPTSIDLGGQRIEVRVGSRE